MKCWWAVTKRNLTELLWPGSRFQRVVREMDAEERIGAAKMKREWDKRESKRLLDEFYKTPLWKEIP